MTKITKKQNVTSGELPQAMSELEYQANDLAAQVERHCYDAVQAGIECGRRLVAIKSRSGGKFTEWVGAHFDYDLRTAQRYMSLAEYAGVIGDQKSITKALAVIADIREEERAAEGKPSRRKQELEPVKEPVEPEAESDPEPERDPQERPSVAKVSEASREPTREEPAAVEPPQLVEVDPDAMPAITETEDNDIEVRLVNNDSVFRRGWVTADRLYWIGWDGIEEEDQPVQLLKYIVALVSKEQPETKDAVVAALRKTATFLEGIE